MDPSVLLQRLIDRRDNVAANKKTLGADRMEAQRRLEEIDNTLKALEGEEEKVSEEMRELGNTTKALIADLGDVLASIEHATKSQGNGPSELLLSQGVASDTRSQSGRVVRALGRHHSTVVLTNHLTETTCPPRRRHTTEEAGSGGRA